MWEEACWKYTLWHSNWNKCLAGVLHVTLCLLVPLDQCQDNDSGMIYQIGDTFQKTINGLIYLCHCNGRGIGEWTCESKQEGKDVSVLNPGQL